MVCEANLGEGKINDEVVANIRSWKHSPPSPRLRRAGGFSVDQSVRLETGDRKGIQRLIQYFRAMAERDSIASEGLISCGNAPERSGSGTVVKKQIPISNPDDQPFRPNSACPTTQSP